MTVPIPGFLRAFPGGPARYGAYENSRVALCRDGLENLYTSHPGLQAAAFPEIAPAFLGLNENVPTDFRADFRREACVSFLTYGMTSGPAALSTSAARRWWSACRELDDGAIDGFFRHLPHWFDRAHLAIGRESLLLSQRARAHATPAALANVENQLVAEGRAPHADAEWLDARLKDDGIDELWSGAFLVGVDMTAYGCQSSPDSLRELLWAGAARFLERLTCWTPVSFDGIPVALERLKELTLLEDLYQGHSLGKTAVALAGNPSAKNLVRLGFIRSQRLRQPPQAFSFASPGVAFSDSVLRLLADSPHLNEVRTLSIEGTLVTPDGLMRLTSRKGMKKLKKIEARGNMHLEPQFRGMPQAVEALKRKKIDVTF